MNEHRAYLIRYVSLAMVILTLKLFYDVELLLRVQVWQIRAQGLAVLLGSGEGHPRVCHLVKLARSPGIVTETGRDDPTAASGAACP